ncbi:MAG: Major facilitator superfamily [Microgenomates group bacterium GW2011_GWA2_47_8]|nr:MAG: Major facilitator superfamily [Microgenomates group bacterium GW2011_GWA2_47_8]
MKEYRADAVGKNAFALVIANRPFRSLWLGQVFSQLAVATMMFVLALRVYRISGSNTAVSGLFLTFGIPAVFFGMAAGAVVDHFDKRKVLMFCDMVRALMVLGFLFYPRNLIYIYVIAFVNALITQFYVPAEAPTIPRFIQGPQLVTANSLFSFTYYSSLALGSILAGPILRFFGPHGVFIFISVMFFSAFANAYNLPKEIGKQTVILHRHRLTITHVTGQVVRDVRDGIAYVFRSKVLLDALILLTGTQITLMLLGTLSPGFADRMLEIDIRDVSLITIGPVVLGIIGGALWIGSGRSKRSPSDLIRFGITSAGIALILIALTVKLKSLIGFTWVFNNWIIIPIEFLLFFLLGIANSMLDVPANSILQKETAGQMRGRVYGILTSAVGGVGMLPVAVGGILADAVGVGKVIFSLGLLITGYGVYRIRKKF